jgi:hypothetical protein
MIQDTSRLAFERVQPKITRSQKEVLNIIRAHPEGLTDAEINYYLGWTINRVTPRRGELEKMGKIVREKARICRVTHSSAHSFKTKEIVLPPAFPAKTTEEKQALF